MKTIYVGNLPFNISEDDIRELFVLYGTVHMIRLIAGPVGRGSGNCAFVEMEENEADEAIQALDGTSFGGNILLIHQAREHLSNDEHRS